jgi:hydroxyacylglutathione hydrolase
LLVVGFPSGAFQANCYLLATGPDAECVIVDPGQDAGEPIARALAEHRLTPVGVLATHGHLDHIHSAASVADEHGVAVWIHSADRPLLSDPLRGLGPELAAALGDTVAMPEPPDVRDLDGFAGDGRRLTLAGLDFTVDHTPGHTPGSVVFRLDTDEGGKLALTGDTLFAGAIGRTDLPGGSDGEMAESLRTRVLPLAEDTVVLPGHGGTTTIGRERAGNPFLAGVGRPA